MKVGVQLHNIHPEMPILWSAASKQKLVWHSVDSERQKHWYSIWYMSPDFEVAHSYLLYLILISSKDNKLPFICRAFSFFLNASFSQTIIQPFTIPPSPRGSFFFISPYAHTAYLRSSHGVRVRWYCRGRNGSSGWGCGVLAWRSNRKRCRATYLPCPHRAHDEW